MPLLFLRSCFPFLLLQVFTDENQPNFDELKIETLLWDLVPEAMRSFDLVKNLQGQLFHCFNIIDKKEKELKTFKKKENHKTTQDYFTLLHGYNSISSSFWWRATWPARKLSTCIKKVIKKLPFLRQSYMFLVNVRNSDFRAAVKSNRKEHIQDLYYSKSDFNLQRKTVFEKQIKFSIVVLLDNTPKNFLGRV